MAIEASMAIEGNEEAMSTSYTYTYCDPLLHQYKTPMMGNSFPMQVGHFGQIIDESTNNNNSSATVHMQPIGTGAAIGTPAADIADASWPQHIVSPVVGDTYQEVVHAFANRGAPVPIHVNVVPRPDTAEEAARVYARAYLEEHGFPPGALQLNRNSGAQPPANSHSAWTQLQENDGVDEGPAGLLRHEQQQGTAVNTATTGAVLTMATAAAALRSQRYPQEEEIYREPFQTERSNSGVSWDRQRGKYQVVIIVDGRKRHLGGVDTAEEAAQLYARAYLREHGAPPAPSVPAAHVQQETAEERGEVIDLEPFRSDKGATGYRGVYLDRHSRKYQAVIGGMNGRYRRHLGHFDTAEEAARAYGRAFLIARDESSVAMHPSKGYAHVERSATTVHVQHEGSSGESLEQKLLERFEDAGEQAALGHKLENSKAAGEENSKDGKRQPRTEEMDLEPFRSDRGNAGYRGVYWNGIQRRYEARIRVNGDKSHLGCFDTAQEAAEAYARVYLEKHGAPPAAGCGAEKRAAALAYTVHEDIYRLPDRGGASCTRPAKRVRVATLEESGQL